MCVNKLLSLMCAGYWDMVIAGNNQQHKVKALADNTMLKPIEILDRY